MKENPVTCPICNGSKVCANVFDPKHKQICVICDGLGHVSQQRVEWMHQGAELSAFRRQHQFSVKEFAKLLKLKECELTDMEYGRQQPLGIMELVARL